MNTESVQNVFATILSNAPFLSAIIEFFFNTTTKKTKKNFGGEYQVVTRNFIKMRHLIRCIDAVFSEKF